MSKISYQFKFVVTAGEENFNLKYILSKQLLQIILILCNNSRSKLSNLGLEQFSVKILRKGLLRLAYINEQKALEQYQYLKNIVGDNIEIDWALVVAQKYMPNHKEMLIEAINRIKDRPRFEQYEVKVHSDDQFVYFSIKFKPDQEAPMQGTLQLLLDAGLSELCKTQINSANVDIDANYDFQQIVDEMQKGERIGTAVLKQTKLEMNLFLHKKFYSEFAKVVQNTDAEMLESPPMAFLKHFKMLDLDLRFKSTDELPSLIKNQVLFGESFQSQNKQELELPITQIKQVKKIIDGAADQGQLYLTILGVGCVKLEATVPNLSVLLITYGKILANMLGLGEFIPDSI